MKPSEYRVEVVTLKPQPTLVVRAELAAPELGKALAGILPRTFQHAMKQGASPAGMPFTRYVSMGADKFVIEAGVPVSAKVEGAGDILAAELPAGRTATVVHTGPYDQLGAAHEALTAWARDNGAKAKGGAWEVYITDPASEPNPQNWQTKVFLALEG